MREEEQRGAMGRAQPQAREEAPVRTSAVFGPRPPGSFAVVPISAARAPLGGGVLRVLIALAGFAGQDGIAFPGQEELSARTGIKKPHISEHLSTLEKAGLIQSRKRGRRRDYVILYADAGCAPRRPPEQFPDRGTVEREKVPGSGIKASPFREPKVPGSGNITDQRTDQGTDEERDAPALDGEILPPRGRLGSGEVEASRKRRRGGFASPEEISVWEPDEGMAAWAAEECPGIDPFDPAIVRHFRDHHKAKGTRLRDLGAAYRNWLRHEHRFRDAAGRSATARARRVIAALEIDE